MPVNSSKQPFHGRAHALKHAGQQKASQAVGYESPPENTKKETRPKLKKRHRGKERRAESGDTARKKKKRGLSEERKKIVGWAGTMGKWLRPYCYWKT